ncbi:hypothetical protein VFC2064_23880 [Listeria monocytogenes]
MNKRVWISVLLEEERDKDLIRALIQHAYSEAKNKLPKYKQAELFD